MHFKKIFIVQKENQIKYGLTKVVNFTIMFLKNGQKTMTLVCIQHIMKENLLFLKDLLEL